MEYGMNQARAQQPGAAAGYGRIGGGGDMPMSADAPRAPELLEQTDRLEKALCFTEDSFMELVRRLEGITRPVAPEPQSVGAQLTAVGPCTAYGSRLHESGLRAGRLGERIQDLLRRLEV